MAKETNLSLTIRIGGALDKTLTSAISGTQSALGTLTNGLSKIGDAGLKAMGALAKGTVKVIKDCTDAASEFESQMSDVVKYVGGLADDTGKISDKVAENGKTFQENYDSAKKSILELSAEVPYTAEDLTRLAASFGQTNKSMEQIFGEGGYLIDAAKVGTAWDISADLAGDYLGKWENALGMTHQEVMEIADIINYTGAHSATTAAEIANAFNASASVGQIAGVDAKTTVALVDAMLATGVDSGKVATSVKRTFSNVMKGSAASKPMKEAWESLGLDAEQVAKSMIEDGTGTLVDIFDRIGKQSKDKQLATITTLFGQWAMEGDAKIVGHMDVLQDALKMANSPDLYTNSMNREFEIKSTTAESAALMKENALNLLKVNIGDEFLPLKKNIDLATRDLFLSINDNIPSLKTLAGSLADLAEGGIRKLTDALNKGIPYVEKVCNYIATHGDQVVNTLGKVIGTLVAMKFSPQITGVAGSVLGGVGNLLLGSSVGGAVAGAGAKRTGGLLGIFRGGQNAATSAGNAFTAARTGARVATGNLANMSANMPRPGIRGAIQSRINTASAALLGGTVGLQNINGLTNTNRSEVWRNRQLGRVTGNITDLQQRGGIRGVLSRSGPGQYISNLRKGAQNLGNTTIGRGFGAVGNTMRQIGSNILGPQGLNVRGMAAGIGNVAKAIPGAIGSTIADGYKATIGKTVFGEIFADHAKSISQFAGNVRNSRIVQGAPGMLSKVGGGIAKGAGALTEFGGAGMNLIGTAWSPVTNIFGPLLSGAVPVVAAITGVIAVVDILSEHMDGVRDIVERIFGEKGVQVFDTFMGKLSAVGDFISGLFQDGGVANAMSGIRDAFGSLFDGSENQGAALQAFDGIVTILQSIMTFVGQMVTFAQTYVRPAIESLFQYITTTVVPMIVNIFNQAAPVIASVLTNVGNVIMGVMTLIANAIQAVWPVIQNLINIILSIASVAIPIVLGAFDTFAAGLTEVIEGAKTILDGLITFVTGVFSGNWSQAWEGVKKIFSGVFDSLSGLIRTPINAVIGVINGIVDRINGLHLTIPDWVPVYGGNSFGLNIPHMGLLAKGGFTSGPSIAGEAGREAVISFDRAYRSANIATWMKAGQLLGMGSSLKEIPADSGSTNVSVQFAPTIQISGNANRADVEQALQQAMQMFESRFEQMYDRMERQRTRRAYA